MPLGKAEKLPKTCILRNIRKHWLDDALPCLGLASKREIASSAITFDIIQVHYKPYEPAWTGLPIRLCGLT